jgi:hypothetical protein
VISAMPARELSTSTSSAATSVSSSSAELVTLTAVMGYARLAVATITLAMP